MTEPCLSRVGELVDRLNLCTTLQTCLINHLGTPKATTLLNQLRQLPLKSSRAVTRLGSYSCHGAKPVAIRLQFAQEEDQLRQTLLHEIAHFLDHQTREPAGAYRNPHGHSWQSWLKLIGGQQNLGNSAEMTRLYRQRLKPVARCQRCGQLLKRLRRLPQGRRWLHGDCGGLLVSID